MCLAFDKAPSELRRDTLWQLSLNDVRVKVSLYIGKESAVLGQHYENLALVVNKALGGSKKGNVKQAESFADAAQQVKSIFG